MNYSEEKKRLLAAIKNKYGIALSVVQETNEADVLRALSEIMGEEHAAARPSEDALLRYLEGRLSEDEAERVATFLEKEFQNAPMALFLISLGAKLDDEVRGILSALCGDSSFLVKKSPQEVIILMPFVGEAEEKDLWDMATAIADTLEGEAMITATVAVDRIINKVEEMPKSLENIGNSILIGSRINPMNKVISFHNLGIGKMLYFLSAEQKEEFLNDNLGSFRFSGLDPQMQLTIQTFFDADLSVTETAKQLFIHRNTLIYRIDKIYKLTGLDLRRFGDAVIAKTALQLEQLERRF